MSMKALSLLSALAVVALAPSAHAHTIANWTDAAARIAAEEAKAPGPPDARLRAQVALAMFEAVNAIQPKYVSYLGLPPSPAPDGTGELAAARAAYDVLAAIHPRRAADLQDALELARASVTDPEAREQGEAAGRAAAAAVLARPAFRPGEEPPYVPAASAGRYIATDLPALPSKASLAEPYFLSSLRDVRPPPPPPLNSARYARDLEEVRRLGGKSGSHRTALEAATGLFWSRQDVLGQLRELTAARSGSLVENARVYAIAAMAIDDASNAVTAAKLEYGLWRPVTAIRNAGNDGNSGTHADVRWEPLLRTPPHPEYPCGHCIVAATFASVVEAEFGPDARIHVRDPVMPAMARTVTPRQLVEEVSFSRIVAGAHFRFSAEAGETMGRAIAARGWRAIGPIRSAAGTGATPRSKSEHVREHAAAAQPVGARAVANHH